MEFKFQDAPGMTRSLHSCLDDLEPEHAWIIYPGTKNYPVHDRVTVNSISSFDSVLDQIMRSFAKRRTKVRIPVR